MNQLGVSKRPTPHQNELETVTLESLVPDDHLLRKVDAVIDFGFIRELNQGLYCLDNGRPPIAPEVLFKTLSRLVWADARDRTDANRQTDWGKRLYARRKETVECSFADAKQLFGPRYAHCAKAHRCQMPMPACRNCPEHQENSNDHGQKTQNQSRLRTEAHSCPKPIAK